MDKMFSSFKLIKSGIESAAKKYSLFLKAEAKEIAPKDKEVMAVAVYLQAVDSVKDLIGHTDKLIEDLKKMKLYKNTSKGIQLYPTIMPRTEGKGIMAWDVGGKIVINRGTARLTYVDEKDGGSWLLVASKPGNVATPNYLLPVTSGELENVITRLETAPVVKETAPAQEPKPANKTQEEGDGNETKNENSGGPGIVVRPLTPPPTDTPPKA